MLIKTSQETVELIQVIEREAAEVEEVKKVVQQDEAEATRAAKEAKAIAVSLTNYPSKNLPVCYQNVANMLPAYCIYWGLCNGHTPLTNW